MCVIYADTQPYTAGEASVTAVGASNVGVAGNTATHVANSQTLLFNEPFKYAGTLMGWDLTATATGTVKLQVS